MAKFEMKAGSLSELSPLAGAGASLLFSPMLRNGVMSSVSLCRAQFKTSADGAAPLLTLVPLK